MWLCRVGRRAAARQGRCGLLQAAVFRHMSSVSDEVVFSVRQRVGIITLNRPKQLNALTLNMVQMMYPKLKEWEATLDMVVVKGSGDRAFCAGGDVVTLATAGRRGDPLPGQFFRAEYQLNQLTGSLRIPYVALQNGVTMGGGCGISVHAPYRVCTEKTLFAMPETAIGFFPDVGGSHFLSRLRGRLGLFLALSGHRLKGRDNQHAGISSHCCRNDQLESLIDELVEAGSEGLSRTLQKYTDDFGPAEPFSLEQHLETIDRCFSFDSLPQIMDALRADSSEFAEKVVSTLMRMSPTSLVITVEQLRRGSTMSLADCLRMELRLADRFIADNDFYEGVRAMLEDKDHSPVWSPGSVEQVIAEDKVVRYFSPLSADRELVLAS